VRRGLRIDIPKRDCLLGFRDYRRGDLSFHDSTKETVSHSL
jgi:hypothetical protein